MKRIFFVLLCAAPTIFHLNTYTKNHATVSTQDLLHKQKSRHKTHRHDRLHRQRTDLAIRDAKLSSVFNSILHMMANRPYASATLVLNEILGEYPVSSQADALEAQGLKCCEEGQAALAAQNYALAITKFTCSYTSYLQAALIYVALPNKFKAAFDFILSGDAYSCLSFTYTKQGDNTNAANSCVSAADMYNAAALLYLDLNQQQQAQETFDFEAQAHICAAESFAAAGDNANSAQQYLEAANAYVGSGNSAINCERAGHAAQLSAEAYVAVSDTAKSYLSYVAAATYFACAGAGFESLQQYNRAATDYDLAGQNSENASLNSAPNSQNDAQAKFNAGDYYIRAAINYSNINNTSAQVAMQNSAVTAYSNAGDAYTNLANTLTGAAQAAANNMAGVAYQNAAQIQNDIDNNTITKSITRATTSSTSADLYFKSGNSFMKAGQNYEANSQPDQAKLSYASAAQSYETAGSSYTNLGLSAHNANNFNLAGDYYSKAGLSYTNASSARSKTMVYLKAAQDCDAASQSYGQAAIEYRLMNNTSAAATACSSYRQAQVCSAVNYDLQGDQYYVIPQYQQAGDVFTNSGDSYLRQGPNCNSFATLDDVNNAKREYAKALDAYNRANNRFAVCALLARMNIALGDAYMNLNAYDDAATSYGDAADGYACLASIYLSNHDINNYKIAKKNEADAYMSQANAFHLSGEALDATAANCSQGALKHIAEAQAYANAIQAYTLATNNQSNITTATQKEAAAYTHAGDSYRCAGDNTLIPLNSKADLYALAADNYALSASIYVTKLSDYTNGVLQELNAAKSYSDATATTDLTKSEERNVKSGEHYALAGSYYANNTTPIDHASSASAYSNAGSQYTQAATKELDLCKKGALYVLSRDSYQKAAIQYNLAGDLINNLLATTNAGVANTAALATPTLCNILTPN